MRPLAFTSITLVFALAIACGGGDDDADSDTSPATEAPTQATAPADPSTPGATSSTGVAEPREPTWFGDYLEVGDCWDDTFDSEGNYDYSGTPDMADCSDAHDNEVFAVIEIEPADGPFPGDDAVDPQSSEGCDIAFVEYVGADFEDTALSWFSRWPEPDEWDRGGRTIVCSAFLPTSTPEGTAAIAGSVKGVGGDIIPAGLPADVPIPGDARFTDLDIAEGGEYVAAFAFPGSLDEATQATRSVLEQQSAWTVTSSASTPSGLTTYWLSRGGTEVTVVVNEFSWGVEWWLYFAGPEEG